MTKKLKVGYDYEIKQEYVAISIAEHKDSIFNFLNIITDVEKRYSKSIFELEDEQIFKSFNNFNYRSLDSFRSIIAHYYEVWISHQSVLIPNKTYDKLNSYKLISTIARKYCEKLTTSLKELLTYVDKVNLKDKERCMAVITLSYMGMKPKAIASIRVGDIDFENRSIITDEVLYTNVSNIILNVLKKLIPTLKDSTGCLIQKYNGEQCQKEIVSNYTNKVRNKLLEIGYIKNTEMVSLRDNACLCYYRSNKKKIDSDSLGLYKILKAFGLFDSKNISAFQNARRKFKLLQAIDMNDRKDEYLFDVEVNLPTKEEENFNNNYNNKSLEYILFNSCKEKVCKGDSDVDNDAKNHREEQENLGIRNEKRVKEYIREYDKNFKVFKMKDCRGYDIKMQIINKIYRLEVKTINKNLEFDISINQLNSIFDNNKSNYVIVVVSEKDIYVVENIEKTVGLNKNFIRRLIQIENKSSMIATNFKIKLSIELFENLRTLDEYLQSILIDNELAVDYAC